MVKIKHHETKISVHLSHNQNMNSNNQLIKDFNEIQLKIPLGAKYKKNGQEIINDGEFENEKVLFNQAVEFLKSTEELKSISLDIFKRRPI